MLVILRRNIKYAAAVLVGVSLMLTASTQVYASGSPSLSAESAALIDADSGSMLFAQNENARLPMASTTKIMTALIALESGDLERRVTVSADAVGLEGSSMYLTEGECLTMSELLYGLMLESANDAAAAIACEIAGDTESFAELMNARAQLLGLFDTHFTNPHGLDDARHYTSARDLAVLTREAMKNERFCEIVSTASTNIPSAVGGERTLVNHNRLLKSYDGAVGVKTGFTKRSGRCLVSAAVRDGVRLIAVTLNAPNDWSDHRTLLDYGFGQISRRTVAEPGELHMVMPLVGGVEGGVRCSNKDAFSVNLPKEARVAVRIEADRFFPAPVSEGDALARAVFTLDGEGIGSIPLFAERTVEASHTKSSIRERILKFIGR